jgi:hypothetical protein
MRTHLLTAAVALAVGAAGSWWFAPRRVEVRTEYKDRWREVTVKKTTKTRTKTTKKADGTTVVDQTVTRTDTDTKSAGVSTGSTLTAPAPRWNVSLLGGMSLKPVGGAHVTYRVVGPFTAGAWVVGGPTTVAGGVSLGVTF